jgi:hypothetical protein
MLSVMRFILKISSLLLWTLFSLGSTIVSANSNSDHVIVNTAIQWQTPAAGFLNSDPWNPMCHYNNNTYMVWVDAHYRPWVTKISGGVVTSAPLDASTDYTAQPDGHHRFSIGVDKNGYLHVTGDMHNYDYFTTGVINPYPVRYQKQGMLYWRSNASDSIAKGFSFAGGLNTSTTMPGTGWLLGRFFNDNKGELFYTSQIHAIEGNHLPGEMGVGLYKYDTKALTWSAIGGLPDNVRPGTYFKTFMWENSGQAPLTWFQNLQPHFMFDKTNRMHFAVTVNSDITLAGSNRIIYAMSDDGGVTWKKADNTVIPGLPIRAVNGAANLGDVVADSGKTTFFGAEVSVVADKNGKTGISVDGIWRTWDGNTWNTNNNQNFPTYPTANYGFTDPLGNLVLSSTNWPKIIRTSSFNHAGFGYDFYGYDKYISIDQSQLNITGEIYGIGLNTKQNIQTILKTTITPAPLPLGWEGKDISLVKTYGGVSGFANGQFVVTNYDTQIDNYNDSFYYVYKPMTGDGYFSARVNAVCTAAGCGSAGIMMRESLNANSRHVTMQIAPGTGTRYGAVFGFRNATNGYTQNATLPGFVSPSWVKLVRAGNLFTGYISTDGVTWTQTGQVTLALPETIFIGLTAIGSYGHGYLMQTATFDNVMTPVSKKIR